MKNICKRTNGKLSKKKYNLLNNSPQQSAVCLKVLTLSPKISKNSAKLSSKSSRKSFIFHSANEISFFILQNFDAAFLLKNCDWSGAKECESCRSRKMLKNAPTLAIVAVHTEENEPPKV